MSIVGSKNAPSGRAYGGRRRPPGDACSSVYEARWLLGPLLVLVIVVAVTGLVA